ncbi:MAG: DUF2147 domain-containing protein [Bacteroidetes bacterium]|nr:DUF2147 domain-containing protein [Bacteroidota bacterium]
MRSLIALILFLSFQFTLPAQNHEHLGYFMSPQENSIFKFYKQGEKYFAKIVWMKLPERKDTLNPDLNKRSLKILGSIPVYDFIFDGKHTWYKGHVYDANTGKTYKSKITRDEKGNLIVRGYIGLSILGKTEYFVKVDFKE